MANGCGVISTLWLAYAWLLALSLDAPAFTFAVAPLLPVSFLAATLSAIVASVFGSRWWLISVALWAPLAVLSVILLAH